MALHVVGLSEMASPFFVKERGMFCMSMATLQLYKNPYNYPDYGSITAYGSSMSCTPVGTGLKNGKIKVKGSMADFMSCNYLALTRAGKTIYAWIEDVTFSTASSFEVSYRVDPWRTYRNNVTLGNQFIERSNTVTYKRDDMLGATQAHAETIEKMHMIGNPSNRILVVQSHVYNGEFFSNTPVLPTPYRFYFMEYNIHDWAGNENLNTFISAITGTAQPENIVTIYSIPHVDTSHLETADLIVYGKGSFFEGTSGRVLIPGFKVLQENRSMQGRLYNETKIDIGVDINELLRVDHSVQLVVPDAGIISIPDAMLKDGDLFLRQDIDMFSGASNYMVVSETKYFTQSIRGSSISSIPIISDPMETYLSQNQNALMTSLIGDVASMGASVVMGGVSGGTPGALGGALSGMNGIVSKQAGILDMAGRASNPPAFLGTALASNFNQLFWTVVTKAPVDNAAVVNSSFGYPMNKLAALSFPGSGYIKTQGCSVSSDGTVPRWAIEEINTMFNNGVAVH